MQANSLRLYNWIHSIHIRVLILNIDFQEFERSKHKLHLRQRLCAVTHISVTFVAESVSVSIYNH